MLGLQTGHVIEHVLVALQGRPLIGVAADSQEWHLVFNGLIAAASIAAVRWCPRNPWIYVLVAVSVLHAIEHVVVYAQYLGLVAIGASGLLGIGGVIPVLPVPPLALHNFYNGIELVLMSLALWHLVEEELAKPSPSTR